MIPYDFGVREMGMGHFGTKAVLMRIRNLVSLASAGKVGSRGRSRVPTSWALVLGLFGKLWSQMRWGL